MDIKVPPTDLNNLFLYYGRVMKIIYGHLKKHNKDKIIKILKDSLSVFMEEIDLYYLTLIRKFISNYCVDNAILEESEDLLFSLVRSLFPKDTMANVNIEDIKKALYNDILRIINNNEEIFEERELP